MPAARHDLAERVRHCRRVGRIVLGRVGDAHPPAQIEEGDRVDEFGVSGDELGEQSDHAVRGDLEAGGIEDLRTDVGVQPHEGKTVGRQDAPHGLGGVAAGQREAELLILMGRRDELVCMGLDADRHPHHDGNRPSDQTGTGRRHIRQPGDLRERVDHDGLDPGFDRGVQLGLRFVGTVQGDPSGRESRFEGQRQLPLGAHVQPEPLLGEPPRYATGQEGLAGVVHVGRITERDGEIPAATTEVALVHHHQRGAVPGREVPHVDASEPYDAVLTTMRAARPYGGRELVQVRGRDMCGPVGRDHIGMPRTGRMRDHIRSGAVTPSRARPLASTCRVARHSHKRATVASVAGSSPMGRMRTAS